MRRREQGGREGKTQETGDERKPLRRLTRETDVMEWPQGSCAQCMLLAG